MKVLIIEDAELPLKYMEEVLCGLNHTVNVAVCVDFARKLLTCGDYDLVLLDHRLPMFEGDDDEPVGYGMIDEINKTNPNAIIVGTSSLSKNEVRWSGFNLPGRTMDKTNPWDEIPRVLKEIQK